MIINDGWAVLCGASLLSCTLHMFCAAPSPVSPACWGGSQARELDWWWWCWWLGDHVADSLQSPEVVPGPRRRAAADLELSTNFLGPPPSLPCTEIIARLPRHADGPDQQFDEKSRYEIIKLFYNYRPAILSVIENH